MTALVGLTAAGCATGSAGSAGSGAPTPGTKQGVKVSIVNSAGGAVQEIFVRELKRFEQTHPGVSAEYVSTAGQNHLEKVSAALVAGTPHDVIRLGPTDTPGFVQRSQIRAIDDLIKRDRYDVTDFFEKCLAQYYWNGKLYALPRGFGNQDVYYNTAALSSAGVRQPPYDWTSKEWTTDDFLQAATKLTRTDGSVEVWGWNQGRDLRSWAPWVWNFGGDILSPDGGKCILDQQPAVDGLQFLQDLIYKHRVMPAPATPLNTVTAMGTGELAMALGNPAAMQNYRRVQGLVFDVAPMPRKTTRLTSGGGVAWHLAAATPNLNEAWELHKFAASQAVQIEECKEGSVAPPRKSVLRSPCFVDRTQPPKGIDTFVQAPEFVHPDPQALGWDEMEAEINKSLMALFANARTARQVAQEIVPQVDRIIKANVR
ncbi:MAG: extracellular solute-binding protein [Chloroflexota bacterium]|nr:extracellular solute-binding protein [Chloroflexota bacterium]